MEWDLSSIPNAKQYDLSSIPDAKERPAISALPNILSATQENPQLKERMADSIGYAQKLNILPSTAYRNHDEISQRVPSDFSFVDLVKREISDFADRQIGMNEAASFAITAFPGFIGAGFDFLANIIAGNSVDDSIKSMEDLASRIVYHPKTTKGQEYVETIMMPFEGWRLIGEQAGDYVYEKTKSPFLATVVRTGLESVPYTTALTARGMGLAAKTVRSSNWFRELTIKERGLVKLSLDDMIDKGYSEGEILRRWDNPEWREQALARRMVPEDATKMDTAPAEAVKPTEQPVVAKEPAKPIAKVEEGEKVAPEPTEGVAGVLDSLNPTGGIFVDYTPEARATMKLGDNMTTLDKTLGKKADDTITIYRGASEEQVEIVPGDYVTTNKQLAKDYAGTGIVVEKKVKLSDVLDDATEPLGEEYIYRPVVRKSRTAELLIEEAKKYKTAEEFEKAYQKGEIGLQFHITDDPNFKIKTNYIPADVAAGQKAKTVFTKAEFEEQLKKDIAIFKERKIKTDDEIKRYIDKQREMFTNAQEDVYGQYHGALQTTKTLEPWVEEGVLSGDRKYVAVINISSVPTSDIAYGTRGFGHELVITNPQNAKVVKVMPIDEALKLSKQETFYTKSQLTDIWNKAQEKKVVKKPVVGGFTAKEILDRRRTSIRTIRDYFGLTDYELRQITKRDIRLMSNKEFKEFKDNIEIKAQKISERKQSVNELEALRKEKMFKSEDNIRKLHKLPTIKNMTKEQVDEYVSILSSYEKGDQFLTPKRIDILDNTIWKGSATIREVLEKASKEFDVPISDLKKIVVNELDRFRYDTPLARQNAFYNFMVDTIKINELRTKIKYFEAREELYRLGKKALASRERGLVGKLIPKQKEVMAYIEAEDADKVILATELTPEEMELANYIQEFYQKAYNYLLINQDLKSSRFADDKYVFHSKRPISELLVDIKETGVKSAISDLLNRWKLDETHFQILDSKTGEILGMRKFFRQTLFRTGELTPSQNIIKSTETYMQQFFNKMALDESVPTIETLAIALRPQEKTKNGMLLNDTLMTFVKQYLNNKKGRVINVAGINQGGKIDTAIRFANNLVSLNYIALNIPLEVAAVVGETTAKTVALGPKKLILANQRKLTKQGRKILEKYKPFTGEGVLEEFFQPARNIGENVNLLMYGLFSWNRKITKQDILLGNMTREEFEKGEINQERLAEVTKMTGRWVDMEGVKSVVGSTSTGGALTKFKGWAIPIVSSTLNDITSLTRSITGMGDKSKRLTKMQAWELLRIAEIGMVVVAVAALVGEDEDRSTFTGKLKFYAIRELTTVFNALSPTLILSVGVTVAFLESLAKNLWLLMTLEEYKTKPGYKGAAALKKQFTPAAIGQFKSEGKQPTYKSRFD